MFSKSSAGPFFSRARRETAPISRSQSTSARMRRSSFSFSSSAIHCRMSMKPWLITVLHPPRRSAPPRERARTAREAPRAAGGGTRTAGRSRAPPARTPPPPARRTAPCRPRTPTTVAWLVGRDRRRRRRPALAPALREPHAREAHEAGDVAPEARQDQQRGAGQQQHPLERSRRRAEPADEPRAEHDDAQGRRERPPRDVGPRRADQENGRVVGERERDHEARKGQHHGKPLRAPHL